MEHPKSKSTQPRYSTTSHPVGRNERVELFMTYGAFCAAGNEISVLTVAVSPVVVEAVPDLGVDGRHCLHVRLAPLSPEVFGLHWKIARSI